MSLQIGQQLGSFEITSLIGKGGMGEVYRAKDTKLKRDVAIKVLPDEFSRDTDRVSRFQREAESLAALNHQNIAAIYDLQQSDATRFLILEFVEGDTLADILKKRGALPVDEAIHIAKQICEALEAAHEKGIIHRDLKPANVKITPDGKVKVLDFGLAKAFEAESSNANLSQSPTLSMAATMQGVILGTAAYMSPEQAKGMTVDRRTDIFSFGAVLYEMLTGRQAFQGDTVGDILAAVIRAEPDWDRVPAGIRRTLQRCLEKDRSRRYHCAADLRIAIEEAEFQPAIVSGAWPGSRRRLALVGAAVVAAVAIGSVAAWRLKPEIPAGGSAPAHVSITLPPGDELPQTEFPFTTQGLTPPLAYSPDGTRIVYAANRNGVRQLYLRAIDDPNPKPLADTEDAQGPFFSPDGQWIGFFAQNKLKKVSISGGPPQTLCDAGGPAGASWGPDDTIVFSPSYTSGLMRVSAAGGTPQVLTTLDRTRGEDNHRYPQFLPGGKAVLFTAVTGQGWDEFQVFAHVFATGERRLLVRGGHTGRYVTSGHLLYGRAGSLLAVPFDLAHLEVTSSAPITVAEGVRLSDAIGSEYSLSDSGSLAYIAMPRQFDRRLVWVDRKGNVEPIPLPARAYDGGAVLSPDGRLAAVSVLSNKDELWIYDVERGTLSRLTSEGTSQDPAWTPDGKKLAYRAFRAGFRNIFWRAADSTGGEQQLTEGENQQGRESWSPDGKILVFAENDAVTGSDIWWLSMEGDRKPHVFLKTSASEGSPKISPDGHWLAYRSNESGRFEIYVQPFPAPGRKFQISTGDGDTPFWNPKGGELFYTNGDRVMAVDVTTSPTFTAGKPRQLFETPSVIIGSVSPDGQRFLATQPVEPPRPATEIHVLLNWLEELK